MVGGIGIRLTVRVAPLDLIEPDPLAVPRLLHRDSTRSQPDTIPEPLKLEPQGARNREPQLMI